LSLEAQSVKTLCSVRPISTILVAVAVVATSAVVASTWALPGTVANAANSMSHARPAASTPQVVVDYFDNGKFLKTDTTTTTGFDIQWKATGCSGKWLSKPVIVLPESNGTINSAPMPIPCKGKISNGAVHDGPIEAIDVLGSLIFNTGWFIGVSISHTVGPSAMHPLPPNTTGMHIYLYGGNVFTKESGVAAGGKIVPEKPQFKIPAGANEAFIHVASATG
jgi:hypothetical protein